jgi:hypothetical protein
MRSRVLAAANDEILAALLTATPEDGPKRGA